jgi:hypothetical protein
MQAGARVYPVPPLPGQHLTKPGEETELDLQPLYDLLTTRTRASSRVWLPSSREASQESPARSPPATQTQICRLHIVETVASAEVLHVLRHSKPTNPAAGLQVALLEKKEESCGRGQVAVSRSRQ